MHNIKCIVSVEALFKARKSSPKQKDWKGWNVKFLWERNSNFPNSARYLCANCSAVSYHHAKLWFPNTRGSSCLRFQEAEPFGLAALPRDQRRIKQAQCSSSDSTFFLKSMSWTSLLRTTSHQTQATNHVGLDSVLPCPLPLASGQDQINTIALIPDQQLLQGGSSIYVQPLKDFGHAMCISIKCMVLDAVLTTFTIFLLLQTTE